MGGPLPGTTHKSEMKTPPRNWIALFQILERWGLEVFLVNVRHVKGVPGRKTDIQDCQWLQYLHSVGLLRGSFRPAEAVCALRSF
jgi:transposase